MSRTILLAWALASVPSGPVAQTRAEATSRYGELVESGQGTIHWADAEKWLVTYRFPPTTDGRGWACQVNKDLVGPLNYVFGCLIGKGVLDEITHYGGCYNPRWVRGTDRVSAHAWALAVDVNPRTHRMYTTAEFSNQFLACWEDAGFKWGGRWKRRPDPMHFSYAGWE